MAVEPNTPEKQKRTYSDDEIAHIYQLGRFHLENGGVTSAEPIMRGLTEVAPSNPLGWLGLTYVYIMNEDFEHALDAAKRAGKSRHYAIHAMLFEVACHLSLNDVPSAGTLLGEIGERIENGELHDPNMLRFYRAQLARYQR